MGLPSRTNKGIARFGGFEANLQTGELYKGEHRVPISEKPFQVLALLVERPGEMVSREEVRRRLWPDGTYVDFDHNLNITIARLRRVLADSSDNPMFIETVGSRGYRFIGHIADAEEKPELAASEQHKTENSKIRLAVLPFENLYPEPQPIGLSDGLTDEIIARLGHRFSQRLAVIARTSTRKYIGTAKDIGQIGRELNVEYILEGSLRIFQEHLHITVKLVQVEEQHCIWARSFDYSLTNPLIIQEEVAQCVAESLGLKLLPEQATTSPMQTMNSQEAYLAYLKGCHYQWNRDEEGIQKSIECFEQVIQIDPTFPLAYNALANSYSIMAVLGSAGPPKEWFPRAEAAARTALKINDSLADPHISLAAVRYLYDWDWIGAEELLRRALELNPSDALGHRIFSYLLSSRGRHEEAIAAARRACELDPISLFSNARLGSAYYLGRRYEEAIEILEEVLDIEPTFVLALAWLGAAYSLKSRHAEAISLLEKANQHYPRSTLISAWLAAACARGGRKPQAKKILDELGRLATDRYVSPFDFALIYAALDQIDQAFEYMEKAAAERCPVFGAILPVDPRLDNLRSDLRYHSFTDSIRRLSISPSPA